MKKRAEVQAQLDAEIEAEIKRYNEKVIRGKETIRLNFDQSNEAIKIYVEEMNKLQIDWKNLNPEVKKYIGLMRVIILKAYPFIKKDDIKSKSTGGKNRKGIKNKKTLTLEKLIEDNIEKSYFNLPVTDIIEACQGLEMFNKYSPQQLRRAIDSIKAKE